MINWFACFAPTVQRCFPFWYDMMWQEEYIHINDAYANNSRLYSWEFCPLIGIKIESIIVEIMVLMMPGVIMMSVNNWYPRLNRG